MQRNDKAILLQEAKSLRDRATKIAASVRNRGDTIPTKFERNACLELADRAWKLEQEAKAL